MEKNNNKGVRENSERMFITLNVLKVSWIIYIPNFIQLYALIMCNLFYFRRGLKRRIG